MIYYTWCYTQVPEKKKSYREIREEQLAKERAEKAAQEAEEVWTFFNDFFSVLGSPDFASC